MAIEEGKPPAAATTALSSAAVVGAPAWVVPAYLVGLGLVFLAERVVVTLDSLQWAIRILGLGLVLLATVVRFLPKYTGTGERASIERLLGILSLVGLAGVGVYYLSTPRGLDLIGVNHWASKSRERAETFLLIAWVSLDALSVLPMLFAEAALHPMRYSAHLEARRVKAAAASGFSLALAVTYCSLFVYSASQTKAQADYSYFKTSEPGSSTRKMVESFTEPLKITAFFPDVSEVRGEVQGYLTELTKGVPNVEVKVVDRYLEPKLAKDMKVFSDGTIVFTKGEKGEKGEKEKSEQTRTLTIGSELPAARAKLKTLDKDVQEQLYKLLRSRRVAYLTVGHGELNAPSDDEKTKGRSADIVQEILRGQNYNVRTLGLAQGLGRDVPDDADIVFILGPTQPFSSEEIDALHRYADRGGHLFMALDADSVLNDASGGGPNEPASVGSALSEPGAKGLDALAKVVGLSYSPTLLVNDTQHVRRRSNNSDRALLISNRFSSHASVSTLSRNSARAALIFARAGSLSPAAGESGFKVDMTVKAMGGTFADLNQNYEFDKDSEKKETYNLAAAVSKPVAEASDAKAAGKAKGDKSKDDKDKPKELRAFVVADADGLSDLLLSNFGPNRLLFMDAVRWLGGEDSFAGEVNDEQDVRIEHSKQKDLVWFYSTIIGAPLLVLAAGLTLTRRARRSSKVVA